MKEYIGSQEHFEDEVNAYYDKLEEYSKYQLEEINKQIDNQIKEDDDKQMYEDIFGKLGEINKPQDLEDYLKYI